MMNNASKAALFLLSACCLLAAAVALRVVPSSRIWPDYQVVYFDENQDLSFLKESTVQNLFPGIIAEETADRSDELIPPDFTVGGAVYHGMFLSQVEPYTRGRYTADSIRSFFFTDRDCRYRLVYVPDTQFRPFCRLLDSKKLSYGTDSTVKAPYGGGMVVLLVCLIMCLLVRPRWSHLLMILPVAVIPFLAPWFTVSCISCAVMGLYPFINRYWHRVKGGLLFIRNPVCVVFLVLIAVLLVLTPPRPLAVTLMALSSSICLGVAVRLQESWAAAARHFSFTPIISGRFVTVDDRQKNGMALTYSLAVLGLLILSLFSVSGGSLSDGQGLSLPGPNLYTESITTVEDWESFTAGQDDQRCPDITDFVTELWQRQSYGFRRISQSNNQFPHKGSTVSVSHFEEEADGVHEIQKDVLVFDDGYLNQSVTWLSEHDSVARFLLSGDGTPSTTYTTTGAFTVTAADYAGIFASIAVAAGLCIVLIIRRTRQRSSEK